MSLCLHFKSCKSSQNLKHTQQQILFHSVFVVWHSRMYPRAIMAAIDEIPQRILDCWCSTKKLRITRAHTYTLPETIPRPSGLNAFYWIIIRCGWKGTAYYMAMSPAGVPLLHRSLPVNFDGKTYFSFPISTFTEAKPTTDTQRRAGHMNQIKYLQNITTW